jgi:hypothetical protein
MVASLWCHMKRTTVMLPADLKSKADRAARDRGLSFGEVVRESLSQYVRERKGKRGLDPLLADDAVYEGSAPGDLAADHDRYLYGHREK